jgi:chlorite dismutase
MTEVATRPQTDSTKPKLTRQFVSFVVYQVDRQWRTLPQAERQKGKQEFACVIDKFNASKRCQVITYTTAGMRADGDILLWVIAYELEAIQELATELSATNLGAFLDKRHSFLAMTKRSMYLDRLNPEHAESRVHIVPGKFKYIFVYPFVKKRDWYLLPQEERQKMMDEHIRIGNKYPSVKLNTAYSFGLDDQEFVVAFESDSPSDFLDLVQELRESQGSMYTLRDTPIITAIRKELPEMLSSLGG